MRYREAGDSTQAFRDDGEYVNWLEELNALAVELDTAEERFQSARDAWDALTAELASVTDLNRAAAASAMLEALSGVRFSKPKPEDMELFRKDLEQAGIVTEPGDQSG